MKKLLAVLLLLGCSPAFAALTEVSGHYVQGNPPGTCTLTSSVGTGQAIVVMTLEGALSTITVSDNVNSGSYSQLAVYNSANLKISWIKTNAAGTPTITVSGTSGYSYVWCFAFTGFTGTPTADTALTNTATGTGTTIAINATSNFANEAMLVEAQAGSATQAITVSGWSGASNNDGAFYAIEASAGTANNFSGTISPSQTWHALLAGIYDAAGATCTHPALTQAGAISVPTAGSTVVRLKNGSFGTVDCSTVSYFQPTVGNFGVN